MSSIKIEKKVFSKTIYDTLLQAYRPYLLTIVSVVVMGFIGRMIFLSNAQTIARFYDKNKNASITDVQHFVVSLALTLAIAFVLTTIYRTVFSRLSAQAVSRIYDETTYRVSRFPLQFFDDIPVGKITTRFSSDYGNVFRLFGGPLAEFLSIIFDLIGIVLLITMTHPYFFFNILIAGVCFYFILKRNQYRLREHRRAVSIQRGPSVAHFSETVQGNLSIRQNNKASSFIKRFFELDLLYIFSKTNIIKSILRFSTELNIISTFLFFANGLVGLYLIKQNILGPGQVTVTLAFTVMASNTLLMFFEWYSQFEEALVGVERMDEFIRGQIEEGAYLPPQSDFKTNHPKLDHSILSSKSKPKDSGDYKIQIEDLTFRYPTQENPTLKNISFKLKNGEKLGIIGRTGAGKSTLISVLLKFYPIEKGVILINNEIKTNIEEHRKQFSLISQDQFFIRGSLQDNLDLFHVHSKTKLEQVLKTVGMNLSLNYHIEEKGQNLSQGEKQLLSLARGLLQEAEIFIFDEATANIDPQSEKLIEEALKKTLADKTQIRIAHRLQTVLDCDKVLWIDHGLIKMIGTPHDVLEKFENSKKT